VITAANSSATNAVASLLSNVASSATTDAYTPATKATATDPAVSSASRAPVDTVDLSDRAKATLARARTEQVAADKLAALVQSVRDPQGKARQVGIGVEIDIRRRVAALRQTHRARTVPAVRRRGGGLGRSQRS
jgi:hypothetical protein